MPQRTRRIVIEAPDTFDAEERWRKIAEKNGGSVASSELVPENSVLIAERFYDPNRPGKEQDFVVRLRAAGVTYFQDFATLKIMEAWRKASASSSIGCIEFYELCEIMIELSISFADFNPAAWPLHNGAAWHNTHNLPPRTGSMLAKHGIVYDYMLTELLPSQIKELHLLGKKEAMPATLALRNRLREQRPSA